MSYDRLSALDRTFLELEGPTTHMHVAGCFVFEKGALATPEGGLDIDALRAYIDSRLHLIPRYRQRIEWTPVEGHPIWVDDERFNIHYHVRHTSLPEPGDERQLKRLAARVMSQQLDRGKPLWEIWIVEGLEQDRFAMVSKTHHCMIDGVSGVDLLAVLLSPVADKTFDPGPGWYPRKQPSGLRQLTDAAFHRTRAPLWMAREIRRSLRDPRSVWNEFSEALAGLADVTTAAFKPASETPLNQPIGSHRRFDWVAFDLDEVKRVKTHLGGTVNDVVLATVSGAVSRFLERRGISVRKQRDMDFRVFCPVSVRTDSERGALGNRVASMVVPMPLGERNPKRRMAAVKRATQDVKQSKQALGAEVLASVSEMTAPTLMSVAARLGMGSRSSNMVVTNVPGPQLPLYLLGARMLESYPMVPLFQGMGIGIALFSYAGGLYWGICCDWDQFPDLHDFVEALDEAFHELGEAADAAAG